MGSYSHGMWGHVLTCQDYQDLIDRGWRRSGRYCYKPTMDQTCCPQYTIKCDATQFQLTKSQRKILKKFRNFIIKGQDLPRKHLTATPTDLLNSSEDDCSSEEDEEGMDVEAETQNKAEDVEAKLKLKDEQVAISDDVVKIDKKDDQEEVVMKHPVAANAAGIKPGLGADPSKPKSRKKKDIRKEKALDKLRALGKTEADYAKRKEAKNKAKTLEDLTSLDFPADSQHTFEIRLVKAQTSDAKFSESYLDSYNVYKKYQMAIHKDSPSKCTLSQFKRFLCNSSLVHPSDEMDQNFGAFHQQYVIDGRIAAVGVIDILPHCVSSVYLYYDPDFAFLSPGTMTSLYEIAFTRKIQKEQWPALKFYYMGYYIHSCPKMRYKAKYQPSWLLCPKTFQWVPVRQSMPLLDRSKYSVLNSNCEEVENKSINVEELVILFEQQAMTFRVYKSLSRVDDDELLEVQEYGDLVGGPLSKRILLYRG